MVVEGTTSSGVAFRVDTKRISDYRFIRDFSRIAFADTASEGFLEFSKALTKFFDAVEFVVGEDFADRVAACNDGDASISVVVRELSEVLTAAQNAGSGDTKKV